LIKIKINPSPWMQMPRNIALCHMKLLHESIATRIVFSNRKRITTGIKIFLLLFLSLACEDHGARSPWRLLRGSLGHMASTRDSLG